MLVIQPETIMCDKPMQELKEINDEDLATLAIYLEGLKAGKGNLQPLGTIVLETLWETIKYLRGDVRYTAKRDKK